MLRTVSHCTDTTHSVTKRKEDEKGVLTLVSSGLRRAHSSVRQPPKDTIRAWSTEKKSIWQKTEYLDLCIRVGNDSCSKRKQL